MEKKDWRDRFWDDHWWLPALYLFGGLFAMLFLWLGDMFGWT